MQRLAGDFLVKQVVMLYDKATGNILELYELPNGQWQFGKGKDAQVVTSLEQVETLDAGTKSRVADWLERMKSQPTPAPVQQGQTPMLAGVTARDQLSQALAVMPEEAIARLLMVLQQVMEPIADSLKQAAAVNSHAGNYDGGEIYHAPGSVEEAPFQLPAGARWCDPDNPASGYFTFDSGITDEQGHPTAQWHPTPSFHRHVEQAAETTVLDSVSNSDAMQQQGMNEPQLAGTGSGRPSRRRR